MEVRLDFTEEKLAGLLHARDFDTAQAILRSSVTGRARGLQDEVLLELFKALPPPTEFLSVSQAFRTLTPDADGFSALADRLEASGAALAAQAAQRSAAVLDFEAQPAMDVWGGAFNGQERRQALFDQLVDRLNVGAIVETGTFRGTTTSYMAKAGLPLFSCEFHQRYFHYSSRRLENLPNVRIERADSRRFLRELLEGDVLPSAATLFYLDAHWEQDLPLWEEIDLIFSHRAAAVIMIDDFRVPADSGFTYDDYGKGKCLSVSNLREAVLSRPSLFFPNHGSAAETGARRGSVVLAQGDLAQKIRSDVPMLAELSWVDALVLDGIAELNIGMAGRIAGSRPGEAGYGAERVSDLQRAQADDEVQLAELRSTASHLELRVHELTNTVAHAEFINHERELEATNARREATAAREAAAELQTLVLRLHEELRLTRATTLELEARHAAQQVALEARHAALEHALHLADERARDAMQRVAELQHSRWRRIGRRLGLARRASFER